MRSISAEARLTMGKRRNFVNYANITLSDGTVLNLTPSDFRISGNNFTDTWNEGQSIQIGTAIGKTATLLLDNTDNRVEYFYTLQTSEPADWSTNFNDYFMKSDGEYVSVPGTSAPTWAADTYYTRTSTVYPHGKFSGYDFYMSYFELYVHLPDATHYQGQLVDEVIPIGTFTVTTPASHGSTIEITGVDNMYMFDKDFDECTLDFNNNGRGQMLRTILNRCCDDCGVLIGYSQTFINYNMVVHKKPEGVSYRDIVSYILQIAGYNGKISVNGALTFGRYSMAPLAGLLDGGRFLPWDGVDNVRDTTDGGSFSPWTEGDRIDGGDFATPLEYHNLTATNGTTVSTDEISFSGVMVSYDTEKENSSTTTVSIHYPNTAGWDNYVMHISDNPFITASNVSTVASTVWDAISSLTFRVFSCSSLQDPTIEAGDCALVYDVKGNIYPTIITNVNFTTGGMTDVSCEADSPVKQNSRYVSASSKVLMKARNEMNEYNTQVARFNEIANAALGYYRIEDVDPQTLSTITYLCNKTTLAASTNIIKITSNGIFISNDGGETYNSGFDTSTATMLMNLIYVHGLTADWINTGTLTLGGLNNSDGILTAYANVTIGSGTWTTGYKDVNVKQSDVGDSGTFQAIIYISNISSPSTFKGYYTVYVTTDSGSTWTEIERRELKAGQNKISQKFTIDASRYYRVRFRQLSGGSGSYNYSVSINKVVTTINRNGITTNNGSFTGSITAKSGYIGNGDAGWTIGNYAIYNKCKSITDNLSSYDSEMPGQITSVYGTYVGISGIRNQYNWYVTPSSGSPYISRRYVQIYQGSLNANNVNLTGTISATSGNIGGSSGWAIQSGYIRSVNGPTSYTQTTKAGTYIGPNGILNSNGEKYTQITGGKVTTNDVEINGGKLAGLTVEDSQHGLSFNNDDYYFSITALTGFTCGRKRNDSWQRLDYTNYHGCLKVDFGASGSSGRGIIVTNAGNNQPYDWGSADYVQIMSNSIYRKNGQEVEWGSSDRRLKDNIEDLTIEEAEELINSVQPRKFEFKSDPGETRFGFIAQELREVLDDSCGIEYTNEESGYHLVHYNDFIAPLCMLVKKQQEEIDDLKARLERLESLVNAKQ